MSMSNTNGIWHNFVVVGRKNSISSPRLSKCYNLDLLLSSKSELRKKEKDIEFQSITTMEKENKNNSTQ